MLPEFFSCEVGYGVEAVCWVFEEVSVGSTARSCDDDVFVFGVFAGCGDECRSSFDDVTEVRVPDDFAVFGANFF